MKTKRFKRVLALGLITAMMLTACGQQPASNTSETQKTTESAVAKESEAASETVVNKKDLPTISLYPKDASLFSGLVTGFRSDYFAEEGGFQLEVWAYSDEKTNAMLTTGDLPDMMYVGSEETLETLIETGKIINYEDYKEYLPNYFETPYHEYVDANFDIIREKWSAGTNGLYILPWQVGESSEKNNEHASFERNVPKLKWDVYEAIGAPEITDLWGLLDIAEDMLEYMPTAEDGTKMYGMFLDNGQDTSYWGASYQWYAWHGYRTNAAYFVEASHVTGEMKSIFDEDSLYKEGVEWYREAFRRGLIDPDSISTARTDQAPKIDNGYAMLPAGTLPGWPSKYYEVFPSDVTVYRSLEIKTMSSPANCIVINAKTEHLEECLAFVNMLADPYAYLNINFGPEGDMWQVDGNVVSITDEFAAWLEEKGSLNEFPMSDGSAFFGWNTPIACYNANLNGYVGVNGKPVSIGPTSWPDAQAITTNNENWSAWKETMDAEGLWDYTAKNDIPVYTESVFAGVATPVPSDAMKITWATIKDLVVAESWKMVYAETDEEFDAIWDQMVEDAMALGAQDIIDWFMENFVPNK